jgi:plastocyanin domain-containing protein
MQKNTIISIFVSILIIGGTMYFVNEKSTDTEEGTQVSQSQNTEIKDGVQYVTITAKGGYAPKLSTIQSGLPTKLIVKTNDTYDCSAALVIRSKGFQKILQPTGEEIIDLGTLKSGETLQGLCSMGMFNFKIKVS